MLSKLPKSTLVLTLTAVLCAGLWCCEKEPVVTDVTGIDISMSSVTLVKGETVQLNAVVIPSDASETGIEWVSVDPAIVKVDIYGLVTALETGETTIMARHGEIVAECIVTVDPLMPEGITLDKEVLDLEVGETAKLTATVIPEYADGNTVTWSVSNPTVATVDINGSVMALASGEARITASCGDISAVCKVYVTDDPKVGDFYYADGKWFSSPIEGELPVGIIFYVGDPAKADMALKSEHPECTHGLALALFEEKSSRWQSGAAEFDRLVSDWAKEDPEASKYESVYQGSSGTFLNEIMGYNNTRVYQLFNADPDNAAWPVEAVRIIDDYNIECPLPETTSGWYIPSAKELSLMCTGEYKENIGSMSEQSLLNNPLNEMLTELNRKMSEIPGAYLLTPNWYLSSTESNREKGPYSVVYTYNQWHIKMQYGYVFDQDKSTTPQAIRPVFAF